MNTMTQANQTSSFDTESQFWHFARLALPLWDIPKDSVIQLLSISENGTFKITSQSLKTPVILRVHRSNYHSREGILTELAWMKALQADAGVETPQVIPSTNGELVCEVVDPYSGISRYVDLFHFIPGTSPDEDELIEPFERLGAVTGLMHLHAKQWKYPEYFDRLTWDYDRCIGKSPNWGYWQDGPGIDRKGKEVLQETSELIRHRLEVFGKSPEQFGLIHSDLRLANLLVDHKSTRVIDFDDCGLGWFLYDIASSVSFIETHPNLDQIINAWVRGYRTTSSISNKEISEIPTFIMLRRMTLLAWIGSHSETELARQQGNVFGKDTISLAKNYLKKMSSC